MTIEVIHFAKNQEPGATDVRATRDLEGSRWYNYEQAKLPACCGRAQFGIRRSRTNGYEKHVKTTQPGIVNCPACIEAEPRLPLLMLADTDL